MAIYTCGNGPCTAEVKNSYKKCPNLIESWTGRVLLTGEHNWHDDSDFFAIVWDAEAGRTREIEYASTRGWTYHNYAVVDADDATRAKAEESWRRVRQETAELRRQLEASVPLPGKEVQSLTTRGKNKGVVGIIRRIQPSSYSRGNVAVIEVAGEAKHRYIEINRVKVINPEQYLTANEAS
jgi:hypothetical protein